MGHENSGAAATKSAFVEVSLLRDRVLEIRFDGHATGALISTVVPRVDAVLGGRPVRWVLFETTTVTGYSIDVRGPGAAMLDSLRALGVERSVAVARLASVRMIGSALALGAGLPLRFVEHRREALSQIEEWERAKH